MQLKLSSENTLVIFTISPLNVPPMFLYGCTVGAAIHTICRTFWAACMSAAAYVTTLAGCVFGKDIQSMPLPQAEEYAQHTTAGAAAMTTAHHTIDASHVHTSTFEDALAAGMGLLDACIATHVIGGLSVLKTLRLVSKSSSTLALRAITGYRLHLGKVSVGSSDNDFSQLLRLMANSSFQRLTVIIPRNLSE